MNSILIFSGYFSWYYGKAFLDITHVWLNFVWFVARFFSISTLLRTLLSPWKRVKETYERGSNFEDFAGVFVVNILTRVLGALIRLVIIAIGFIALTLTLVGGLLFLAFWIVAPILSVLAVFVGLVVLI